MHASLHLALVPKGCNFNTPLTLIHAITYCTIFRGHKTKNRTILDKVIELAAREVSLSLSRLILLLFMAELVALDFFPFFFVAVSIHRILIRLILGDGMRNST